MIVLSLSSMLNCIKLKLKENFDSFVSGLQTKKKAFAFVSSSAHRAFRSQENRCKKKVNRINYAFSILMPYIKTRRKLNVRTVNPIVRDKFTNRQNGKLHRWIIFDKIFLFLFAFDY